MDNIYHNCPPKMEDARFLTDYRSSTVRELSAQAASNIMHPDEYRKFLQKNAKQIMDRQWNIHRRSQACEPKVCIHNYPTRVSPGSFFEELRIYNDVRSGKIKPGDQNYPVCQQYEDYRMTL